MPLKGVVSDYKDARMVLLKEVNDDINAGL